MTVREALRIGALAASKVVAGASGLDRVVEYVLTMDVPDVLGWVRGNELLLSSGYAIEDAQDFQNMLRGFSEAGVAAVALKEGRYLNADSESLSLADRLGLPVILLPKEVLYHDVVNPLMRLIIERQNGPKLRMRHEAEICLDSLMRLISTISADTVLLLDSQFRLLSYFNESGVLPASKDMFGKHGVIRRVVGESPATAIPIEVSIKQDQSVSALSIWPLALGPSPVGYLVLLGNRSKSSPQVLSKVLPSLSWLAERLEAETYAPDDLLRRLEGTPNQRLQAVDELSTMLGPAARQPFVCFSARWGAGSLDEYGTRGLILSVFGAYSTSIFQTAPDAVWSWRLPRDASSKHGKAQERLLRMASAFASQIEALGVSTPRIGISSVFADTASMPQALEEARRCSEIADKTGRHTVISDYARLDQLLLKIAGSPFENDVSRLLEAYLPDQIVQLDETIRTLSAYFKSGRNARGTAHLLGVHRNTVAKRLARYERITALRLDDPEACLGAEIALRLLLLRSI